MKINLRGKINIKQFSEIGLISLGGFLILLILLVFSGDVSSNKSIISSNAPIIQTNKNLAYLLDPSTSTKSLPARLIIKAINVDANIDYVGLNSIGEMAMPTSLKSVAWYSPGTVPGQTGSAVIAGHLNGKNGETGVFKSLNNLKTNDKILVENTDGTSNSFIVTKIKYYDPLSDAKEVFFSSNGTHLNLITCAGEWDESTKEYSKRLVVFADLVSN